MSQANDQPTSTPTRRHDLDALRAVAMLLGIALHAALSFVRFPWVVQDTRQHELFGLFFVAVHGFRMPLFFVLSGFFTAMLWRRHGLKALARHRVKRILLPLALCLSTIVPVVWTVSGIAMRSAAEKDVVAGNQATNVERDIWGAAKSGDLAAIDDHIANGADVDAYHPDVGVTPLALAASNDQPRAVEALLRHGAKVGAPNKDGGTALHGAAFFGRAETARLLVEAGADVNARNADGTTSRDTLAGDWRLTEYIGGLLSIEVDEDAVNAGRLEVAKLLGDSDGGQADIWTAVKDGEVDAIERQLAEGVDIDGLDLEFGVTPLGMAAIHDQTKVVELLLEKGADVNARGRDGGAALHAAAFLGRAEVARLLIDAGADLDARNTEGATPLDTMEVDWGLTEFVGTALRAKLDREEVTEGREEVAALLPGGDPDGKGWSGLPRWLTEWSLFAHLWFLWFLCWLVGGFAIYAIVMDRFGWRAAPDWLILSPLRYAWLIPLTLIPQWFMGRAIPSFGPDTSSGLLPMPRVLAYYAIFFGFGALYFDSDDRSGRVGKWWWLALAVSLVVALPLGLGFLSGSPEFLTAMERVGGRRLISSLVQVVYAWGMTFGLMGLFRAAFSSERRWLRYVSDSSYWLYVTHLPLIMFAQVLVRDWQAPALLKFVLVCGVVTGGLLLIYQTLIRYRWLGTLLNGRRYRPGQPAGESTA